MSPRKAASTKERIEREALKLFRKRGFDRTTLRDIAKAAGTSLGSTYYYFPSKEALVLGYFEQQMVEHERLAQEAFRASSDLGERVRAAFSIRLDLMRKDRKFFGGLFRSVGDVESPVSVFSKENSELRLRGIRVLEQAVSVPEVPEALRAELAYGLWALMLGMVLYFVHDESPEQQRTAELVTGSIDLIVPLVPLLALPQAEFFRERVMAVLDRAGLLPEML
ncbi:MAG: TetR/AcrR family transcriptional regulator [Myxococcales bacterium]|nr:TetR/AcrR family transcriptional regulator [Myxococcales bacterium]MCB9581064.1 TetR/AcrR family transcriptional regulator [Polyangiaceae bacterium]